tara:strand:- start:2789 stop:3613 length:825 start_codon:yes stop_codon:yes gene_type:complete
MAAEIRVDTIKARSGINTLATGAFSQGVVILSHVGVGTTSPINTVTTSNNRKLAAGIGTFGQLFVSAGDVNVSGGNLSVSAGSITGNDINVGTAATIKNNGNATFSGIVTSTEYRINSTILTPGVGIKTSAGVIGYGFTTLNFVGAGNTFAVSGTTVDISIAGGGGSGGGVSETETAVSSTSATTVGTFTKAGFRSAAILVQITQGSAYQVGRYLLIHDGTTVTTIEESAIATGSMLGTFEGVIDGSDVDFNVTMSSSSSATVTTKLDTISIPS